MVLNLKLMNCSVLTFAIENRKAIRPNCTNQSEDLLFELFDESVIKVGQTHDHNLIEKSIQTVMVIISININKTNNHPSP